VTGTAPGAAPGSAPGTAPGSAPGSAPGADGGTSRAIRAAADLVQTRAAFEAHEILEPLWLAARTHDRAAADFLRGLIHLAAAAHHRARGNAPGERAQRQRAARLLGRIAARARGRQLGWDRAARSAWFAALGAAPQS